MNEQAPSLVVVGASARAAAFSALRAGLRPWCADLFADTDLATRCPVVRIDSHDYPHGFLDVLQTAPKVPWIYTGGLENRPALVERMARVAPLWGNGARALQLARDPFVIAPLLEKHDLPAPAVRPVEEGEPPAGCWLLKPRAGAGGAGIRRWEAGMPLPSRPAAFYFQQFLEGEACSAVFVAVDGQRNRRAGGVSPRRERRSPTFSSGGSRPRLAGPDQRAEVTLLGVTRQLVGVPWLNAADFHYCGSVSFPPTPSLETKLQRLGQVLAEGCGLLGLFGVDFILRDGSPYLIEINPRYTASVEVVEHASGTAALAHHRRPFDLSAPVAPTFPQAGESIGKAILFARKQFTFPERGPWSDASGAAAHPLPAFADIPRPGEVIEAGSPICTLFARGDEPALRRAAVSLMRALG